MATFSLNAKHAREKAHSERIQAKIRAEVPAEEEGKLVIGGLPGDPWKLRGIPVVGVLGGVGGAIPGSKPHADR